MCALFDALDALSDQPRKPLPPTSGVLDALFLKKAQVAVEKAAKFDTNWSVEYFAGIEVQRLRSSAKKSPELGKLVLQKIAAELLIEVEGMPS